MAEQQHVDFYIVGIGTSAGGLEALENFFSNMPPDNGVAFVVVQHLSPDYESHMVELLSKYTSIRVHEAQDGMPVERNTIYLIPRRKNMTIFKGKLFLVDYDRSRGLNLPIDIFFESLAQNYGERAIGIILSGTGSDGTRGIRAIKEMGGMVMAQDDSAKFDGMPRSAILTQLVDYIASPEDMPANLLSYVKHPCLATDPTRKSILANDEDTMSKLFTILRSQTEIDFADYKPNTIVRRIERRMSINQIDDLAGYVDYLQQSPDECQSLFKEFLIGVTKFFRDPEAFELLQNKVIPTLFAGKSRQDQIRVWVTGCSTGEEAYSLAILFREQIEKTNTYVDVKIFATDIDSNALNYASQGAYPESIMADVSADRIQNYFIKKGDTYEVLRNVRSMVVFAHQNLIKDPPFSRMNLIACRNLLIYLKPVLQKRVLELFQFALNPGGVLFLGSSETIGNYADHFSSIHNKWKIYQYEGGTPPLLQHARIATSGEDGKIGVKDYRQPRTIDDWRSSDSVLRSLVEQMMPPCVVVDEKQIVIHAFGDVRDYLEAPIGYRVNLNILNMARQELSLPLSTALHRTMQEQQEVIYKNIKLQDAGQVRYINLKTRLFWERNNRQRLVLVTFEPIALELDEAPHAEEFNLSHTVSQRITNLEQELQYTKENLQATIEELETSNEELQATNEELLAANEELQSTNEELQSVNEELITVNNEYQLKIRELTDLNNDINNLLTNTDIGTIFLDTNLSVRKFTPAAQADINLLDQDIGRPFAHISHNFFEVDLVKEARYVLETGDSTAQEIQSSRGMWYIVKTLPYTTHTRRVDGVVITLVDLTQRKKAEEKLRLFQTAFTASTDGMTITDPNQPDNPVIYANPAYERLTGYQIDEIIGRNCRFLQGTDRHQPALKQLRAAIKTGEQCQAILRNYRKDGTMFLNELTIYPLHDFFGNLTHFVGVQRDVTNQLTTEQGE